MGLYFVHNCGCYFCMAESNRVREKIQNKMGAAASSSDHQADHAVNTSATSASASRVNVAPRPSRYADAYVGNTPLNTHSTHAGGSGAGPGPGQRIQSASNQIQHPAVSTSQPQQHEAPSGTSSRSNPASGEMHGHYYFVPCKSIRRCHPWYILIKKMVAA